jgi:hypothetical protein
MAAGRTDGAFSPVTDDAHVPQKINRNPYKLFPLFNYMSATH